MTAAVTELLKEERCEEAESLLNDCILIQIILYDVLVLMSTTDDDSRRKEILMTLIKVQLLNEHFTEALQIINENNSIVQSELVFEHAYCLYRSNKFLKAIHVLDKAAVNIVAGDDVRLDTLRAQVLYRLERFEESVNLYEKLLSKNEDERLLVNLLASRAALAMSVNTKTNASIPDEHVDASYETQFNASCYYAAQGDMEKAKELLETGIEWARRSLVEDEMVDEEDDEIEVELAQYHLQNYYINKKDPILANIVESLPEHLNLLTKVNMGQIDVATMENVIKNGKLSGVQRKYAMFNLAISMGPCMKAVRILRPLTLFKPLELAANACLCLYLTKLHCSAEIADRREKSETFKLLREIRRPIRYSNGVYSNSPAIYGVLMSRNSSRDGKQYFKDLYKKASEEDKAKLLIPMAFVEHSDDLVKLKESLIAISRMSPDDPKVAFALKSTASSQ